ncbi:diguanylate cyclase [Tundrisphaera sp. TA3]|uniref:diguanylate cyclase n=1 Tax=Tundrisphaera sp. TA3 TaxID=3435775 RepID=UPI003EB88584
MHVLIAEDQPSSALAIRRLLGRLGHESTIAEDGQMAWEMVQTGRYPVLLSDWIMPGMDGIELCRRIRSRRVAPYQYIILLTSKRDLADRLEGLRAGADDFLVKPPHVEELAVRLEIAGRILGFQDELVRRNRELAALADSDELTGAKNRRHFLRALEDRFFEARRLGSPLSLILLDIDHFKAYNDAFGHPAGDEVLRLAAGMIGDLARCEDVVARIGGEEFAAILPGLGEQASLAVCERIRRAFSAFAWPRRAITASLGAATLAPQSKCPADLIAEADLALYASKRSGRDRVSHHRDLDDAAGERGGRGRVRDQAAAGSRVGPTVH